MTRRRTPARTLAAAAAAALAALALGPAAAARPSVVDLGPPFWNFVSASALLVHSPQGPAWVAVAAGYPAMLGEVQAGTGEVVDTARVAGAHAVYGYAMAAGTVYLGGSPGAQLYAYVPGSGTVRALGSPDPAGLVIWCLAYDAATRTLYGGLGRDAALFAYDTATGRFTDLGPVAPGHAFVRSLAVYDGVVYAGLGGGAGLVAYDPSTGTGREILPPAYAGAESVDALQAVRGLLFVHLTNGNEVVLSVPSYRVVAHIDDVSSPGVSPQTDGLHVAYLAGGGVYEFNLRTRASTRVSGNLPGYQAQYLAGTSSDAVALVQDAGPDFPGWSVAGMVSKGTYWLDNPERGYLATGPVAIHASVGTIESAHASAGGDVYASSYLSGSTLILDPSTNALTVVPGPGQAESIADDGGDVVFGVYPGAALWLYDPTRPWNWGPYATGTENPRRLAVIGQGQDRPMSMAVGPDGTLYVATVPIAGALGGALSAVSPDGKVRVYRNLIPGQSPISLVWDDGLVVGSTTVFGGVGAHVTQTTAQIFAWNPATGKLVATLSPFPDTPVISALTLGPNGWVYGLTHTEIFAYDPSLNAVVASAALPWTTGVGYGSFDWGADSALAFGPDGNLYGCVDGRAFEASPATLQATVLVPSGVQDVMVAADGRIYLVGDGGTHVEELAFPLAASAGG